MAAVLPSTVCTSAVTHDATFSVVPHFNLDIQILELAQGNARLAIITKILSFSKFLELALISNGIDMHPHTDVVYLIFHLNYSLLIYEKTPSQFKSLRCFCSRGKQFPKYPQFHSI